jgi:hypothetical protein
MLRRIVIGVAGAGILGLLGFLALAWRPAIIPIDPPAKASFPGELIAKGEVLAGAGYCVVWHTRQGGPPFAGGYGLRTPFGMLFSTNITPEPETGIGRWSLEAFTRAMHEGEPHEGRPGPARHRNFRPTLRKSAERLAALRTPEGSPLLPNVAAELEHDMARLGLVMGQIKQIEDARRKRLEEEPESGRHAMVRLLAWVVGVGIETADMLVPPG